MIFYDIFSRNIILPLSIVGKYKIKIVNRRKVLFFAFFRKILKNFTELTRNDVYFEF